MKNILLITIALFTVSVNAQVLYNDNFDNYTLGNLGTDPTGVTPGQGGWLTKIGTKSNNKNNLVTITNESNKGKVLTFYSSDTPSPYEGFIIKKNNLNTFIDQRTLGNNVIKFEIEYFTGNQMTSGSSSNHQRIILNFGNNLSVGDYNPLIDYGFHSVSGQIGVYYHNGITKTFVRLDNGTLSAPPATLPFNTWVTFIVYLDYNNKKVYFETPYFNTVPVGDFLSKSTSTNLIDDFKPSALTIDFVSSDQNSSTPLTNKYDNIKITALKSVPPYVLSAANFLADKFNLYPNPATTMVNITNNENRLVNKIEVYDTTGKLINMQNYNNEAEIQLNVENLASGTYMLHLQTNEGVAVKKLVKK